MPRVSGPGRGSRARQTQTLGDHECGGNTTEPFLSFWRGNKLDHSKLVAPEGRAIAELGRAFVVVRSWVSRFPCSRVGKTVSTAGTRVLESTRARFQHAERWIETRWFCGWRRLSERLRRSAALHDEAALHHDKAAEYWSARKEPERAEIERRSAELERAHAKLEREARADVEEREEAARDPVGDPGRSMFRFCATCDGPLAQESFGRAASKGSCLKSICKGVRPGEGSRLLRVFICARQLCASDHLAGADSSRLERIVSAWLCGIPLSMRRWPRFPS